MTNTEKITQLVGLWFETIAGLHHKDRDCHFRIAQHWEYAGESKWEIEHAGYLLRDEIRSFKTREEAEAALIAMLCAGILEWIDCEDGPVSLARRAEIKAAVAALQTPAKNFAERR